MNQQPDKITLRRAYASLRDSLTQAERTAAETAIYESLFSLPAWREATVICGYMSVRGELNTTPILRHAAAEGKTIALPVTITDAREGRMIFRSLPEGDLGRLTPARFGIPEPDEGCPELSLADFSDALILVPALAFDTEGYRLGYGGGYYDRFLEDLGEAKIPVTTAGLAFGICTSDALPHDPHDIPVHFIIDERRILSTHGAQPNSRIPCPQKGS